MKAIAIIALVFSAISIIIPGLEILLAMLFSLFALISFRSEPTLSGVTFGLNIIITSFLSPMLLVAEAINRYASTDAVTTGAQNSDGAHGDIYFFYVGFYLGSIQKTEFKAR